ncbi:3-hydroxybenzoate--CoA/4-hydroxybenzoate--CoA ligase [Chloroflexota bacterium]|nr:3-hydroxybenzoate--CoA/4-hydroxybenzoate--CoA ligase [Chloroflexota bacterium]
MAILEHNLEQRADKVALLTPERELTFRQVSEEVNRLGNALKSLDVRMGEYVGILAPDCAEWAVSYFAIMKIGAIAVGMNTLLKPLEHLYALRDCRARVLIIHQSLLASLQGIRDQLDFVANIIVVGGGGEAGDLEYRSVVAAGGVQL